MEPSRHIQQELKTPHETEDNLGVLHLHDYSQESKRRRLEREEVSYGPSTSPLIPGSRWTSCEDKAMLKAVLKIHHAKSRSRATDEDFMRLLVLTRTDDIGDDVWEQIAESILKGNKSAIQCFKRYKTLQDHPQLLRNDQLRAEGRLSFIATSRPRTDLGDSRHSTGFALTTCDVPNHYVDHGRDASTQNKGISPVAAENEVPCWTSMGSDMPISNTTGAVTRLENVACALKGGKERVWLVREKDLLRKLVEQSKNTAPPWDKIAAHFFDRSPVDCLTMWQSLSISSVIKGKGSWTPEEDQVLVDKKRLYGRKWTLIAAHLPGRLGKQCRERYVNHLDPVLRKGEWSEEEDSLLISLHTQHGNKWTLISQHLPGRSHNDTKNHWYSTIQRRFQQEGKEVCSKRITMDFPAIYANFALLLPILKKLTAKAMANVTGSAATTSLPQRPSLMSPSKEFRDVHWPPTQTSVLPASGYHLYPISKGRHLPPSMRMADASVVERSCNAAKRSDFSSTSDLCLDPSGKSLPSAQQAASAELTQINIRKHTAFCGEMFGV
jgi:Myb-like DNA-binding domain